MTITPPSPTTLPPILQGYLLGFISLASFVAGLFFLKFWKQTRDSLFLLFAIAFFLEGGNRVALLFVAAANEGSPAIYLVRMVAALLILAAILHKNAGRRSS